MDWLSGKKTYVVAAGIVMAALGAFLAGDATLQEALVTALEGLGLATLRIGIAKGGAE